MTLRPVELMLVAEEIEATVGGRALQRVVQPDARTLLLGFAPAWLLVSVDTRFGRIHLLGDKPAGTGASPPAFCMLLRKHLGGARLASLTMVPGERALGLDFVRPGPREAGAAGERLTLRLFFYGAGGRIVLVDAEGRELGATGAATGPSELPPPRIDERGSRFAPPAVSAQVEAHYRTEMEAAARAAARGQQLAVVRREVTRLRRLAEQLAGDLERGQDAEELRRDADLLLAHLTEVPSGATEVTLKDDFADGVERIIRLDPARTPVENATRLYRDYQRRTRGRGIIARRLEETRAELARREGQLAALETSMGPVSGVPSTTQPSAPRRRAAGPRPPYRLYRSASGDEILVGRNAAKNDELTFHVARGDDLWLHTRDVPGAHVVVALRGRPLTEETLLDAATLAIYHSPAREERQADVTYAPRKLVRKPRGVAPGQVSVAGGKTIRLRMEPDRLARLLATRSDEDEP